MDGIAREREVAAYYRDRGYLVASRRHEPGPGDLVCIPSPMLLEAGYSALLVEVKATRRPFERFGPRHRRELEATAERYALDPVLIHWPRFGRPQELTPDHWPGVVVLG